MEQHTSEAGRYALRGVSSSKSDVHKAIAGLDKGLFPKAFCKIIPDLLTGDPEYCLVMHADGAGTKSSLAYCYWKATGDLDVWKGISQDAIVMNTDDLLCVGATGTMLLSSTIGRNRNLVPGEVIAALIDGSRSFCETMAGYGLDIALTGGETADVGDLVRTVIVDSTVCARMRRSEVIDNARIRPGDVIVGLCSYGQAHYETAYNGGMGSNGLTSARHDVFCPAVAERFPESFDPALPQEVRYCGLHDLTEVEPQTGLTYGKLVLSPTRTYLPVIKAVLDVHRPQIHGMVHCSGGAQTKILHFVEQLHIVKDNLFPVPPLFEAIQKSSGTPWEEMYKVFNMGHRMELYVPQEIAQDIIRISQSFGVPAQVVGRVCPPQAGQGEGAPATLTLQSPYGTFHYTL